MSDDYLQPDFDLGSLTVPRLRSILVEHEVHYPSSAKKPELIDIVSREIIPKARKLLSARARTKRSSRGITDVPSSQEGTLNGDDDNDEELMPPPPVPKTPRSRKSKSNMVEDNATAATPSTSKRARTPTSRRTSSKHARQSDTETDIERPKPSARKSRKSQIEAAVARTPSVQIDEPDERIKRERRDDGQSPFSEDNPFQSGSSPIPESRRKSTSGNRKSLGTSERRKSTSRRRQTTSPQVKQEDGFVAPSRTTFEFPVARLGSEDYDYDGVDAGEDFEPSAQRELEKEQAISGALTRRGPSTLARKKKKTPTNPVVKYSPWAILSLVGAAVGTWYRQEKIDIGYCGVGQPSWSLASNPQIPQWIHENFQPSCEPCPPHAYCSPGMEATCEDGFLLAPHPLSFAGAVPLPPTCMPDNEKARRVKAVADRAVEDLRERRAAYECGEEYSGTSSVVPQQSQEEEIKAVTIAGKEILEVPEETLKQVVSSKRRKGMNDAEFDELWRSALGDIIERDEIVVIRDGSTLRLSSTSLARLPLTCFARRSLVRQVRQHRTSLTLLTLLSSAAYYIRSRLLSRSAAHAQVPSLVQLTFDRLATQAALKEQGRVGEGFLSIGQLRDDILRNVLVRGERERVWKEVKGYVEGNANVRVATREEGRTGEWSRVWEWIGPTTFVTNGFEGRSSGGGGNVEAIEGGEADANEGKALSNNVKERRSEISENRKWDEGKAIY